MSQAPLPIRGNLRRVSPEELAEINNERPDGQKFPAPKEALERLLRSSMTRLPVSELRLLAEHPDELVRVTLVRLLGHEIPGDRASELWREYRQVFDDAVRLALLDADAEGMLWTPVIDACFVSAARSTDATTSSVKEVFERKEKIERLVRKNPHPKTFETLAQFSSGGLGFLQLMHAHRTPALSVSIASLLPNMAAIKTALENANLVRKRAIEIIDRILELAPNEIEVLEQKQLDVFEAEHLRHAPPGWGDSVIQRALAKNAHSFLKPLLHKLPGVSQTGVHQILRTFTTARGEFSAKSDWLDKSLFFEAILHPACPPEFRRRLLAGKYRFTPELVQHPSADAELLHVAWRWTACHHASLRKNFDHYAFHQFDIVKTEIFRHPNISKETAIEVLSCLLHYDIASIWSIDPPSCLSRPEVAIAYLNRMPNGWVHTRANALLSILASSKSKAKSDTWLYSLAASFILARAIEVRRPLSDDPSTLANMLDELYRLAQHRPLTLDQGIVGQYLQESDRVVREKMTLVLAHAATEAGLIDRDFPRWRAWVNELLKRQSRTLPSNCPVLW